MRGHAGPLRRVWPFAQKRDARSPAAFVTAYAEIQKVISSFEFENSISSTRICNECRFFDPRLTSLIVTSKGLFCCNLCLKKFQYPNSQLTTPSLTTSRRRCKIGNIQVPHKHCRKCRKQITCTECRLHSYRMHLLIASSPVFQPEPRAVFWVLCANVILSQ